MLIVLCIVAAMIGAPLVVGIACHVAMRKPSIGVAIAVGLFVYASHRADQPFSLAGISMEFVGTLVAGAFAVAGGFVAAASLVGSVHGQRPSASSIASARIARSRW